MQIGKRVAAIVLAGATVFGGAVALADVAKDWPQFRGSMRDNVSKETGLLKEWPKQGPPLAWTGTGIGDGHSSVSVANGKIFTSGRDGDAVYAVALNEADGKSAWKSKRLSPAMARSLAPRCLRELSLRPRISARISCLAALIKRFTIGARRRARSSLAPVGKFMATGWMSGTTIRPRFGPTFITC